MIHVILDARKWMWWKFTNTNDKLVLEIDVHHTMPISRMCLVQNWCG